MKLTVSRPEAAEYSPFFQTYLSLVQDDNLEEQLRSQHEALLELISGLSDEDALFRYQDGKWSIKELLGHLADTERIMSYRLLRVARGDKTPLPGFDEVPFVQGAEFDQLSLSQLRSELGIVRSATLSLCSQIPAAAWTRIGSVSGHPVSARALAYIIVGHELHHQRILRERYLNRSGSLE